MKIGIEAKWLFRGPPSGRRVVRNLVRSLFDVAEDDELHLFLDARSRGHAPPAGVSAERCHYVWAPNNQLGNLFVVPRIADRLGLDAVIYHNFVPPPRGARHARVAFVYDVIFESHPSFFTWRERLYFKPLRYLTSTADRVCTLSENEKARLVRFGYADAQRVDVVPIAVDDAFGPGERAGEWATVAPARFVLYAGRVTARKNVAALVRAMALVRSPGLELVVAGAADGTGPDLAQVAVAVGVTDRVRLLGAVSDETLRALYAAAVVFCFPSLDEGFGLPPLEAMASGTPVVVSNAAALAETCGDAAVYVDATDPTAIAGAIDTLVADTSRHATLREAGLRRAGSFTWRDSARRLLASVHAAVPEAEIRGLRSRRPEAPRESVTAWSAPPELLGPRPRGDSRLQGDR